MRLPFLRSKDPAAERGQRVRATDDAAAVDAARTRARRRLSGALVLLLAGVIGFPLLFETQPRPLPVDTPIEVPSRDLAAAPVPPQQSLPARPLGAGSEVPADAASAVASTQSSPPMEAAPSKTAPPAAAEAVAQAATQGVTQGAAGTVTDAAVKSGTKPAAEAPPATPARSEPTDDGARARALLEGGAVATAPGARYVVQVGAFSDADTLRQARQRVEKLGLKTYTQVIDTAAGKRTRVRVGPYASRQEAEAAAARIKGAGLPANILTL